MQRLFMIWLTTVPVTLPFRIFPNAVLGVILLFAGSELAIEDDQQVNGKILKLQK